MANTFKIKTNDAMPQSSGTPLTLYTVQSGETAVVLGLLLCNVHTSAVNVSVQIVSDTNDHEVNQTVFAVRNAPIPVGGTLEVLTGSKVVLQTTDVLKIDCSVSAKIDATLSVMEIS